jgi:hypothetical protein
VTDYDPGPARRAELKAIFSYHRPSTNQPERYEHLRSAAYELALDIVTLTPPSREQALAITSLQQTIMWANAAIAINEPDEPVVVPHG